MGFDTIEINLVYNFLLPSSAKLQLQLNLTELSFALFSFNPSYMWLLASNMWLLAANMWLLASNMWLLAPEKY